LGPGLLHGDKISLQPLLQVWLWWECELFNSCNGVLCFYFNSCPVHTRMLAVLQEEEGLQGVFKRLRRNGHQLEKGLQMAQRGPSLK
jgi:hypothetical protein